MQYCGMKPGGNELRNEWELREMRLDYDFKIFAYEKHKEEVQAA